MADRNDMVRDHPGVARRLRRLLLAEEEETSAAEDERFRLLVAPALRVPSAHAIRSASDALASRGVLVVAFAMNSVGTLRRVPALAAIPVTLQRTTHVLRRSGFGAVGRYGVSRSFDQIEVVFELGGPAASYAQRSLLVGPARDGLRAIVARALERWTGFSPSVGGLLLVARKT